jgi:hypothetical protein
MKVSRLEVLGKIFDCQLPYYKICRMIDQCEICTILDIAPGEGGGV